MSHVLVVSPHPDDEILGCGGALHRHLDHGDAVHVVHLTSGERSVFDFNKTEDPAYRKRAAEIREEEARHVAEHVGYASMRFLRRPDGELRADARISSELAAIIGEVKPAVLYAPHPQEEHPDHRAACRAARGAVRQYSDATGNHILGLTYEVWTPLQQFRRVIDISPYMTCKQLALARYESQCESHDYVSAITALNRYRGCMASRAHGGPYEYAEVYGCLSGGERTDRGSSSLWPATAARAGQVGSATNAG